MKQIFDTIDNIHPSISLLGILVFYLIVNYFLRKELKRRGEL